MRLRYDLMRILLLSLLLVPLAACGQKEETTNRAMEVNATAFVPPPVVRPKALPGQDDRPPLDVYVGKYPHDPVDGVGFYDRTEVANALIDAVGDEAMRRRIAGEATEVPIFTAGERIAAWGCEPHNCGPNHWVFLLRRDGTGGEACHHTDAMGGASRWYAGGAPVMRPGDCPKATT
jgi:hypothetical protein